MPDYDPVDGGALFGERFLEKYAGHIIDDPNVAIVELVANAWDAHATQVSITWPTATKPFKLTDNGEGMTADQFDHRWRTLDYERTKEQGSKTQPPSDLQGAKPRQVYGRNGRGRHAAFYFGNPYTVVTVRDGIKSSFRVSRSIGEHRPFDIEKLSEAPTDEGHGTTIIGGTASTLIPASLARQVIGSRFLTDPDFSVLVDGVPVTFEDLDDDAIQRSEVHVEGEGTAEVWLIDALKSDRSTRQHGMAWWVNKRLVGECRWRGKDLFSIIDGRTAEAKRYTIIVFANFLEDAVKEDWSDFDPKSAKWIKSRDAIAKHVRDQIAANVSERRSNTKATVRSRLSREAERLAPSSREVWDSFVNEVIDNCPGISIDEITKVAEILANLEASSSKYDLIHKLHALEIDDLEGLSAVLSDWSIRTLKEALDEIKVRLGFIKEMHSKLRDTSSDEVRDLQPLFEQNLWVFGPEYESIEFTSNKGMSTVLGSGPIDVRGAI